VVGLAGVILLALCLGGNAVTPYLAKSINILA
jgi:hypothetical protein